MAEWVANMKDVFVSVICGKSEQSNSPVAVEECGECVYIDVHMPYTTGSQYTVMCRSVGGVACDSRWNRLEF